MQSPVSELQMAPRQSAEAGWHHLPEALLVRILHTAFHDSGRALLQWLRMSLVCRRALCIAGAVLHTFKQFACCGLLDRMAVGLQGERVDLVQLLQRPLSTARHACTCHVTSCGAWVESHSGAVALCIHETTQNLLAAMPRSP